MLHFQIEAWSRALPELRPLFSQLWEDVAVDKDRFVAKCAEGTYAELEKKGMLHVVTARTADRELAGYFVALLNFNPHYAGAGLFAYTDMYFLKPAFRKGTAGLELFQFMEKTLRAIGVVKVYSSHKIHRSRASMFKLLGFQPTDIVYSKIL